MRVPRVMYNARHNFKMHYNTIVYSKFIIFGHSQFSSINLITIIIIVIIIDLLISFIMDQSTLKASEDVEQQGEVTPPRTTVNIKLPFKDQPQRGKDAHTKVVINPVDHKLPPLISPPINDCMIGVLHPDRDLNKFPLKESELDDFPFRLNDDDFFGDV